MLCWRPSQQEAAARFEPEWKRFLFCNSVTGIIMFLIMSDIIVNNMGCLGSVYSNHFSLAIKATSSNTLLKKFKRTTDTRFH